VNAVQRDDLERVREATDLVELVGAYVALRKAGKHYKGLCPFHQEKTPSFVVFPESQTFHCFGCGAGGDAIGFLMRAEQLGFREALERLAERAGIALVPARPPDAVLDARLARLAELNTMATAWFSHVLWNTAHGEPGRRLLEQRGVDREVAERFQLGFAPEVRDALLAHLARRGATSEELLEAGLAVRREDGRVYDRFRYRLIFPIRDREGRVIGFGARALGDAQPKYLNSPQTALFDKSASLYAIDLALEPIRRAREVVVVEGYMDAVTAHQFGYTTVVASMGTALTERQVRLVRRLVDRIVLALDADAAGQAATLRGLDVVRESLAEPDRPALDPQQLVRFERTLRVDVRIARLPEGTDPDALIRRDREAWERAIRQPVPLLDFYLDAVIGPVPPADPRARSQLLQRIGPLLWEIGDRVVQEHYVREVARRLQVREELVRRLPRAARRPQAGAAQPVPTRPMTAEEHLVALLLRFPQTAPAVLAEVADGDVVDARHLEILQALRGAGGTADPAALPEPLQPYAGALVARLGQLPETPARLALQMIRQALQRLRRERHDERVRALQDDVRAAEAGGDREALRQALELVERLKRRYPEFYPAPSPYFPDTRSSGIRR
jgi:DNA primase